MLKPAQRELLRAVQEGKVAWRHHLRAGWAIRRTDVRSTGPGGGLGRRVTQAIERLAAGGLVATVPAPSGCGPDVPITITEPGRALLDLANLPLLALTTAAAAPTLPMARDGREPFPAGDEGDAPSGALLDLTDDEPDHPEMQGWWQRQGHQWIPVDPPADDEDRS
ncbi:hypothetical protein C8D87_11415 [Lentzea atacamensis]|uniref:MarR family transcriptional regulator n=1 Tax=Lentzea atacamensis TaxID=531938 RepID=A0ABX9DXX1_9PSEU|nr:hypothetical protein [Lentzea atacamensis]RAS59403.1 hypothetical protein C8D87_11415 [Lentzea atacamensis]